MYRKYKTYLLLKYYLDRCVLKITNIWIYIQTYIQIICSFIHTIFTTPPPFISSLKRRSVYITSVERKNA